jgi:hypothetical protein
VTEASYCTNDPQLFHREVAGHYRLYLAGLITGKEFADATGETLRRTMNFQEAS